MDATKILTAIQNKYNSNKGTALSIEYALTHAEFTAVAADLFRQYPSIQTNYHVGVNNNKIQLTLGYV